MNRYAIENLFGIEGLNIAWYGIIIACGMVLGFALAIYRCRKTGINKEHIYNLALWLIPVCIICARAYYVIFEWDNYKNDLLSVFEINRGGLAIYGGVLGGVAVALIYCKVKWISFWSLADTLMPSLVLGQAIGRWGNFVNQEAYGNQITNPSLCFFPYGVYLLPFYMIGYGTIRLFVEGLRSDSLYLLPGIRVSQVLSGCLIILGIVILFIIRKRQAVRQ